MTFRVHYHLHTSGGRLCPTHADVDAATADEALARAERLQRTRDARRGRAYVGHFASATAAEQLQSPPTGQKGKPGA